MENFHTSNIEQIDKDTSHMIRKARKKGSRKNDRIRKISPKDKVKS